MKIRSDSLYARLSRAGQLDEFFAWLHAEDPSYDAIRAKLQEWGEPASVGAIHNLISVHGLRWKIVQATRAAQASEDALPANADEIIRRRVKEQEFSLVFDRLTNAEKISLLRLQLERDKAQHDDQKLSLEREKFRESVKSAVEKGLDAVFEEIRGNAEAEGHFRRMKEAALQGVKEAA